MPDVESAPPAVELTDAFWAPRQEQLRDHTLPVILERLEATGSLDAFRRLRPGGRRVGRRGMWFSDSDVYKWMEAAAWAGRFDLLDPVIELIPAAVHPDGYLHTFYDAGAGSPDRYRDLDTSHEWYCAGHFTEAALAHHDVTGETVLLDIASRWADHLCDTFGPGLDERTDGHPEAELALAKLSARTGETRYLDQARWIIEQRLVVAARSIDTVELAGHAVKVLYLATGIAEIARVTGDDRWLHAAARLFDELVRHHSYPTGGVGGRWLDESVGKRDEMPESMAYAESCAAVAAVRFCQTVWELTGDSRALDQLEVLAFNAVPCGVGADGESWFYSQPQAVTEVAAESNPWALPFEYGQQMLLSWFPARRHRWFPVACCPTNLARIFATIDHHIAGIDATGNLLVHLPIAARIMGGGWDVEVAGDYPEGGVVDVRVHAAPTAKTVRVRVPGWAGGAGHSELPPDGRIDLVVTDEWWETDHRVEGAAGTVFLRRGPVVYCVEGGHLDGVDLRDLVVDPDRGPNDAFHRIPSGDRAALHRRVTAPLPTEPLRDVPVIPYHAWANRGPTTMRYRFARR